MRPAAYSSLIGLMALSLTACASKGSWMGAEKEAAYDKEAAAVRMSAGMNNDDYFELMHDGRILVFADAKNYKAWLQTGEIAKSITKFRAGPNGEQVRFDVTSAESKAMEGMQGMKSGAQNLFEGNIPGLPTGFFGFIKRENTYFVFDGWPKVMAFRANGTAEGATAAGPNGSQVVYVGAASVPADLAKKFSDLHDGK